MDKLEMDPRSWREAQRRRTAVGMLVSVIVHAGVLAGLVLTASPFAADGPGRESDSWRADGRTIGVVRLAATSEETPAAAVAELPAEGSSPPVAEPVDEPIALAARDLETPAANAAPQLTIETLLAERTAIEPLEPLANGTPTLAGGRSATEMTTSARGRRGVVLREGGTVGGPHAVVFEAASEAARAADGEREGDGPGLDLIGALVGGSGGGTPVCKPRRIPQRRVVHRR